RCCNNRPCAPSYEQKHNAMQRIILLPLLLVALNISAQEDSTGVKTEPRLDLKISSDGGTYARVSEVHPDSTKKDPVVITTKRKKIISTREPRPWDSVTDSLDDRLAELRRERRRTFTYWSGLDVGVNTLLGPDGDADLDRDVEFMEIDNSRSRFVALNIWERKLEFGSHHAGLFTGLGFEFVNYRLKNDQVLQVHADSIFGVPAAPMNLQKNKLRQI